MKRKLLIATVLVSLVFGGCTGQNTNITSEPARANESNTMKVAREDQGPSQGGVLNLFMMKPETLNPLVTKNPYVRQLSGFVFDQLFCEASDGVFENMLAKEYTVSQDGLIYDIKLMDNVLFHDGQALTADDVVFSIKTIKDAGQRSLFAEHVKDIQSVTPIDSSSIRILLNKPDNRFVEKLEFPVLPQHIFKDWPIEGHNESLKLIGTGPFRFNSYMEESITLLRNDSWWNISIPGGLNHPIWLDGITFKVFNDQSYIMPAFQKKEIDIACIEEDEFNSYSKRSDIFLNKYESNILEFLILSPAGSSGSPIANESFREIIIDYLMWYHSVNPLIMDKPVIDSLPDYYTILSSSNREKTMEALNNAGFTYKDDENTLLFYKNGVRHQVSLSIKYNSVKADREKLAQWITAALFELGISVVPETASYSEQQDFVKNGRFDMMLLGCRIPLHASMDEALELAKESLNIGGANSVIIPLYKKYGAVLYHNHIRGARTPVWENIYNGWSEWYLVQSQSGQKK